MANANIDYTSMNFEYSVLTKIHEMPTYMTLHNIKNKLKANAASVPYNMGGGVHGYLGLILILNIPAGAPTYGSIILMNTKSLYI